MLLIIVLETKNDNGSDYLYYKSILSRFYQERGTGVKLQPVFMNSKTNYKSIGSKIAYYQNQYASENHVIYFCDYDKPELNFDQRMLNNDIIQFCNNNNYDLVWFNRTIEDVLIGKIITDNKTKIALNFYKDDKIYNVDENKLYSKDLPLSHKSNVLTILDVYLPKKR